MGKLEPAAFETLERLGHGVVSQLRQRLALLALEITEEEIRFSRVLGWQLVALFLTCLTLTLAVGLVIAAFWDTDSRVMAMSWMLFITAAGAAGFWRVYHRRLVRKPIVFSQTVEELRRDAEALLPQVPPAGPGLPGSVP